MKTIQVFDKPMCCSTGVCGLDVDPVLPRFAADLEWLKTQGHRVERYNLAQQPAAFMENKNVLQLVAAQGAHCLPLVVVDGCIVSGREYPTRERLAAWTGDQAHETSVGDREGKCCGGSHCC